MKKTSVVVLFCMGLVGLNSFADCRPNYQSKIRDESDVLKNVGTGALMSTLGAGIIVTCSPKEASSICGKSSNAQDEALAVGISALIVAPTMTGMATSNALKVGRYKEALRVIEQAQENQGQDLDEFVIRVRKLSNAVSVSQDQVIHSIQTLNDQNKLCSVGADWVYDYDGLVKAVGRDLGLTT